MSEPVPPEILARVKENFEWWNGGEPQLMLNEYAEDGELDLSAVFVDTPPIRGHEGHAASSWTGFGKRGKASKWRRSRSSESMTGVSLSMWACGGKAGEAVPK